MSTTITPSVLTGEDLVTMPDDGIERDIIRGQLRERPMTRRNRRHSRTTANLARLLGLWLQNQPPLRGELLCGDAAFRLKADPETTVGIDVAYISQERSAQTADAAFLIEGPPVLAVEVLSPNDAHQDIVDKIALYLETGVAVVWIADPELRTVTVHRNDSEPVLYSASQELRGDPELPGFRVKVADLFSR
jgi:Uma2 family endonuclease